MCSFSLECLCTFCCWHFTLAGIVFTSTSQCYHLKHDRLAMKPLFYGHDYPSIQHTVFPLSCDICSHLWLVIERFDDWVKQCYNRLWYFHSASRPNTNRPKGNRTSIISHFHGNLRTISEKMLPSYPMLLHTTFPRTFIFKILVSSFTCLPSVHFWNAWAVPERKLQRLYRWRFFFLFF